MRGFQRILSLGCLLLAGLAMVATASAASPAAVVDQVQMPAWIERGDVRLALAPGRILQNRDRLTTGADGRVVIRMQEGSAVKLGGNAHLTLNALGQREAGVFTAGLDVAAGAFRFTTGVFSRVSQARVVNVRVGGVTAGIRGTDLWGSSDAERDLVCLLEGRIAVMHPLAEASEMSEPLSVYAAAKGHAPKPVETVSPGQLAIWAAQTEIQPGSGVARRGGRWKLTLATFDEPAEAFELYDRARLAGYPVHVWPRPVRGDYRYVLQVKQLASKAEAEVLAERLSEVLHIAKPVATPF